ncbi:hypothetical protein OGAPHI_003135 [Ogataea philodendri]|uniref:Uncharacterized protein n=1 Tax=Ogataea philodendri TaxID=1378263 RepID=A0A9P8T665_9ASCO|nr:uncharacterized protein OGAPHI_003135 [Ogataea philodendri]KAH3667486.1 hypothetical protein OGAPHI_003135 [Ogataea philodendri]
MGLKSPPSTSCSSPSMTSSSWRNSSLLPSSSKITFRSLTIGVDPISSSSSSSATRLSLSSAGLPRTLLYMELISFSRELMNSIHLLNCVLSNSLSNSELKI